MTVEIRASSEGYRGDGNTSTAAVDRNQNAIQTALWKLNPDNRNGGGGRLIIDDSGYGVARGGWDVPTGVTIEGLGPMATTIGSADGSNRSMFVPHMWGPGRTPNAFRCTIRGLTIDVRRSHQTTTETLCGIWSETNPWNTTVPIGVDGKQIDYEFDPTHLFEDLEVRNADTAIMIVGRSGIRLNRVVAHACVGAGFICDFDTTFLQCQARFSGAGFFMRLSNNQLALCTSFNNRTYGYRARGTYDSMTGCTAQQNGGSSFDFAGTIGMSASGLVSSDPGYGRPDDVVYGYDLDGARQCNIHGVHKGRPDLSAVRAGDDSNLVSVMA